MSSCKAHDSLYDRQSNERFTNTNQEEKSGDSTGSPFDGSFEDQMFKSLLGMAKQAIDTAEKVQASRCTVMFGTFGSLVLISPARDT